MKSILGVLKIIAEKIKKTLWVLGLHAFSLILFIVIIDIIFGGFIFYKYVFLAEKKMPEASQSILKFNLKAYQDVSARLDALKGDNVEPAPPNQLTPSE